MIFNFFSLINSEYQCRTQQKIALTKSPQEIDFEEKTNQAESGFAEKNKQPKIFLEILIDNAKKNCSPKLHR